jgi:hypothetical protein
MPTPNLINLVGAHLTDSVLTNLTTGSSAVKTAINTKLNTALKSNLVKSLNQGGYPVLSGLVEKMGVADIASNQNATIQAFVTAQIDPLVAKDPAMRQAVDAEAANLSTITTVGTLLNLSQPLQSHPLFQAEVKKTQIVTLLSTIPSLSAIASDFVDLYATHTGSIQDFWTQLGQNTKYKAVVPQIQFSLQLGAFTFNNIGMVQALQSSYTLAQFRDLTQLNSTQLTQLISSQNIQIPPGTPGGTAGDYAAAMMSLLVAAYPTDFVRIGLKKSNDDLNQKVATFLVNSPDFDFATTNVDVYLSANFTAALKGVEKDQIEAVTNRIKAVQRVFRVNSDPVVIETLIAQGLDSARKIASIPQALFMREYANALGGQSTALLVYNGARQIAGMVSSLYRRIQETVQQANPTLVGNANTQATEIIKQYIPNWQTLFGSLSYCQCDECGAMDGPAAYFVDLLQFLQYGTTDDPNLNASGANASGYTPLDVLIGYQNNPNNFNFSNSPPTLNPPPNSAPPAGRRPDLAYLKLTCANSDTPLPYVDLVNEILESYVYYVGTGVSAEASPLASSGSTSLTLTATAATTFPNSGSITQINSQPLSPSVPYTLQPDNLTLSLQSPLPAATPLSTALTITVSGLADTSNNTPSDATPDELSVNPEYTIQTVYSVPLVSAIYPFNLPYDRFLDTARIYLNFLGSSRYQLLQDFGIFTAQQDQLAMMAAEFLNMSQHEYELITEASFQSNTPAPSQYVYSSAGNYSFYGYLGSSVTQPNSTGAVQTLPWNQWLIQVPEFLKRTGLAYIDLVSLLETQYLNPGQNILLQFQDGTCNVNTAQIVVPATTTVTIGGSTTAGDTVQLILTSSAIAGSPLTFSYIVAASDTLESIAANFNAQINSNAPLSAAGISASLATATGVITISAPSALNPSPAWTKSITPSKPSATATEVVTIVATDFFSEIPAFLRLWKRLGWQMPELDKAITAMNTGGINRSFVLAAAQLKQLQGTLKLPVNQLVSLWASIDIDGRDSLYVQLFQNKTVINPLDSAFQLVYCAALALPSSFPVLPTTWSDGTNQTQATFNSGAKLLEFVGTMTDQQQVELLTWAGSNDSAILAVQNLFNQRWYQGIDVIVTVIHTPHGVPVVVPSPISAHFNTILAALQVAADDLTAIAVDASLAEVSTTGSGTIQWNNQANLTLANLSTLYRYSVLANALGLSVEDLISLKTLTGMNPFELTATDPVTNNMFLFVQAAQMVAASKFSVAQLNYLYRALPDLTDSLPPLQATQDQLAVSLSAGLQKIAAANAFTPDPSGAALRKKLAVLLPADQVDPTMSFLDGAAVYLSSLPVLPSGPTPPAGQVSFVTSVVIGGAAPGNLVTSGDTVTLSVNSSGIPGSPVSVSYPVGDTLGWIAEDLASQINNNATLSQAGIKATPAGQSITIAVPASLSPTPQWSAGVSNPSGTVSETMAVQSGSPVVVNLGGNTSPGDILTLSVAMSGAAGFPVNLAHTAVGDTPSSIAAGLATQINNNPALQGAKISASATGSLLRISSPSSAPAYPAWTGASQTSSNAPGTETVGVTNSLQCLGPMNDATFKALTSSSSDTHFLAAVNDLYNQAQNILSQNLYFLAPATASATSLSSLPAGLNLPPVPPGQVSFVSTCEVGGELTPGDQLTLTVTSIAVAGSPVSLPPLTVTANDTLSSLAAKLASQINANSILGAARIFATVSGGIITFSIPNSLNPFPVWSVPPSTATEKLTFFTGLVCSGSMMNSTKMQLEALSANAAFTTAVSALYSQAWNVPSQQLIDMLSTSSASDRYNYVLENLLDYLCATQSQNFVKQTLSQALDLDATLVALLVEGDPTTATPALLPSKTLATQPAMVDFLGGLFASYYAGTDLKTGPSQAQIDPGVALDGTETAFGSAQWFARIVPPTTDTYTFQFLVPAGAPAGGQLQLWVNGQLIIDTVHTPNVQNPINLTAGQIYDFQLNFVSASAARYQFQLQWGTGSASQVGIPPTAFVLGADASSVQGLASSTFVQGGIYSTLSLLNRVALLVNGFSMQARNVAYLSDYSMDFQGVDPGDSINIAPFDLSTLPLDYFPTTPNAAGVNPNQGSIDQKAVAFFNQWQRLNNLYTLKASLPSGNTDLFDIFQAASQSPAPQNANPPVSQIVLSTVLQATGWNQTDFATLGGQSGFNLADESFINEKELVSLAACLSLGRRLGISAQQLFNWANQTPDVNQAQDMINTVKAKYSDATWVTVGKPLSDKLRENSKDALIAYILNMPPIIQLGFSDADDLYDYFLIDVQMCSCMITSRIVQATAAVQQYVQRCLLNLENANSNANLNVSPSAIDGTEWENWRKNYRVWQAAVQVFLYPENWIDPTLRDNRTPFFLDLQNQLMQGSVTANNVEAAYLSYLEKLWQVTNLEIMGICNHIDATTGVNITHVFGRTYSSPHIYFYRNLDNNLNVWSAWQKMDVDIVADQLIPVVWNSRLYVFWPNYKENTDPANNNVGASMTTTSGTTTMGPPAPTKKTLEVTMSWSEYRQGAWTKKQTTPDANPVIPPLYFIEKTTIAGSPTNGVFVDQNYPVTLDTTQFSFNATTSPQDLEIQMNQSLYLPNVYAGQYGSGPGFTGYLSAVVGTFLFSGPKVIAGFHSQTSQSLVLGQFDNPFPTWESTWTPVNMGVQWQSQPPVAPPPDATDLTLEAATGTSFPITYSPFYVLEPGMLVPAKSIPKGYSLMFPQDLYGNYALTTTSPIFFFQDSQRTFFVSEETNNILSQFKNPNSATPFYQASQMTTNVDTFETTATIFSTQANPDLGTASGTQAGSTTSGSQQVYLSYPGSGDTSTYSTEVPDYQVPSFSLGQYLPDEQWKYYLGPLYMPGTLVQFNNHYHPWVSEFIKTLNWKEIPGLLDISTQELGGSLDPNSADAFDFYDTYGPTSNVALLYPQEIVDYSQGGAYSMYNWELFFHIPFLIATQLSQNQQFADAKTWFEYIFNPTIDSDEPVPNRYWNFLYFNRNTLDGQIADLLTTLLQPNSSAYEEAYNQVQQWWANPFDPDLVARLRPVAYQKALVMAYIDNLVAWGDNLFSQNTRESINEATQLYVLADKILGPKPVMVPPQGTVLPVAYKDMHWNALDNALVQLENAFPFAISSNPSNNSDTGSSVVTGQGGLSTGTVPYFCTPVNSQLLSYWDTVADRLYKIRHCMNIQGQVQQLALFSPPINPALLVRAAAAGVDLSSVLGDINAAVPNYRFTFMLSKAVELCAEVRSLGGALLSALEKKDAEALSLLRAGQELAVLQAVLQIKQNQIDEAQANLQGLQDSLAVTHAKQNYYQTLVSGGLSSMETAQVKNLTQSQTLKQSSQTAGLAGSGLSLIPQISAGGSGAGGSPVATFSFGGEQLSTMASMVAQAFSAQSEYYSFAASMSGLTGGWARRAAEWGFQLQTAGLEITQINDQINAANFRAQIAQEDFENQNLEISNAQSVQDFLTNKYTKEDLYSWMIDQVSAVYFQCYQMAYDLAKRAEACFRYELGLSDSNFIQFGYWDSLKQGLLSGERLYLDLKRLEGAYLDQNKREYEITKNISLVLLDPGALIALKETGQCLVSLPEPFFDMDYPGHYLRRIKSVSLTIPCVTGPYTSVNCTLTLLQSKIRSNTQPSSQGDSYLESPAGSDPRFFYNYAATQSIATSTAQNDCGMFEVNFRDERYLPFEGGGVVSQWLLSLPQNCNAFDFETITDVIMNLKYTARDGGGAFGAIAQAAALWPGPQSQPMPSTPTGIFPQKQSNLARFFSLRHEFPTEWYKFLNPLPSDLAQTLMLVLTKERFPFQYRGKKISVSQVDLLLKFKNINDPQRFQTGTPLGDFGTGTSLDVYFTHAPFVSGQHPQPPTQPPTSPNPIVVVSNPNNNFGGTPYGTGPVPTGLGLLWLQVFTTSTATLNSTLLDANKHLLPGIIEDIFMVCHYSAS